MKWFSTRYQRYKRTYTTWEFNDWTGQQDRNDWNCLYMLYWEVLFFGAPVLRFKIIEENVPEYAQAAWGALGYSDWFEKHSLVDEKLKEITNETACI